MAVPKTTGKGDRPEPYTVILELAGWSEEIARELRIDPHSVAPVPAAILPMVLIAR